jgi:hypothetical protein
MTIDATAVRNLAAHFTVRLLRPANQGYDEARRIWNGHIDRRPALIAQGPGVADVTAAVRFVRGRDLLVAGVANR